MTKKVSYRDFCIGLGLPLKNYQTSWCAINSNRRQALFTLWEDEIDPSDRNSIDFTDLMDTTRTQHGAREFRDVIAAVVMHKYDAFGVLCTKKTISTERVRRQSFRQDVLISLDIRQENDRIIGRFKGTVPAIVIRNRLGLVDSVYLSAIDDTNASDVGNDDPEYKRRMAGIYVRDERVRARVIKRAKGVCEYCHHPGFIKRGEDEKRYLEAHHIIKLSEAGVDRDHNVIALCANDHREAHFGRRWEVMQDEFQKILEKFKPKA